MAVSSEDRNFPNPKHLFATRSHWVLVRRTQELPPHWRRGSVFSVRHNGFRHPTNGRSRAHHSTSVAGSRRIWNICRWLRRLGDYAEILGLCGSPRTPLLRRVLASQTYGRTSQPRRATWRASASANLAGCWRNLLHSRGLSPPHCFRSASR